MRWPDWMDHEDLNGRWRNWGRGVAHVACPCRGVSGHHGYSRLAVSSCLGVGLVAEEGVILPAGEFAGNRAASAVDGED